MQVVSGLGREIPSPNGGAIRGAIQTDAAINAGYPYEVGLKKIVILLFSNHFSLLSNLNYREERN